MKRLAIIFALLLLPSVTHAAADLQILNEDIYLSEEILVAGDTVRIYGTVTNVGTEDVSGYVTFYQGSVLLGDSQVISLLAEGRPEEIYVDFVVPSSNFNLQATIRGTSPEDLHLANNVAITQYFEPILDDDRDGISNDVDNCPSVSNSDQTNHDGDSQGDSCDDDDDNDGLSDSVENELGTSTSSADTDGDGVNDADDAYPNDPTRTEIEPEPELVIEPEPEVIVEPIEQIVDEVVVEEATPEPSIIDTFFTELAEVVSTGSESGVEDEEEIAEEPVGDVVVVNSFFSPNAVFRFDRNRWNTYTFEVLNPASAGIQYQWSFGDGVTSSKNSVEHAYSETGKFEVSLLSTNSQGETVEESVVVYVPFFSLGNRLVLMSVATLMLLMLIGIGFIVSITMQQKQHSKISQALDGEGDAAKPAVRRSRKIRVQDEGDD